MNLIDKTSREFRIGSNSVIEWAADASFTKGGRFEMQAKPIPRRIQMGFSRVLRRNFDPGNHQQPGADRVYPAL
jgi:hypothetical protein